MVWALRWLTSHIVTTPGEAECEVVHTGPAPGPPISWAGGCAALGYRLEIERGLAQFVPHDQASPSASSSPLDAVFRPPSRRYFDEIRTACCFSALFAWSP
jgi:hypothetical protein